MSSTSTVSIKTSESTPLGSPLRSSSSLSALPLLSEAASIPTESLTKSPPAVRMTPKSLEKSTSLGRSLSILVSDGQFAGRSSSASLALSSSGSMRGAKIKQHSLFDIPQHMLPLDLPEEDNGEAGGKDDDGSAVKVRKKLTRDSSEGTFRKKKHGEKGEKSKL